MAGVLERTTSFFCYEISRRMKCQMSFKGGKGSISLKDTGSKQRWECSLDIADAAGESKESLALFYRDLEHLEMLFVNQARYPRVEFAFVGANIVVDATDGMQHGGSSSGFCSLHTLVFTPVVEKDLSTLRSETNEALSSNRQLRVKLKYTEGELDKCLAAKAALERENKALKKAMKQLERPLGSQDLAVVQPKLLKHIEAMGKLIARVGKKNMRVFMAPAPIRRERVKRRRVAN